MLRSTIALTKYSTLNYGKVFRFLLFGGLTLFIYYVILWILFSFVGLPYREAITISYSAAIIFHFLANRKITFNAGGTKFRNQLLRYLSVALLNYVIQLSVIRLCYEIYGIDFYISTFSGLMLTMITGYLLMNFWVFKAKKL